MGKYLMLQGSAAASSKRETQFYRLYALRNKVCRRRGRETENGKRDAVLLYILEREPKANIACGYQELILENGRVEKWIWACNICDPLNRVAVLR